MNFLRLNWRFVFCLMLLLAANPARSQSITPAPDGTGTLVTPNGQQYDIGGGSFSGDGANLFHSFQELGLNQGEIANFLASPQVQNILGRVVGGNASVIDGLIQVTGSNANLFLVNPAGIVFGANASLNLPADFTATTATGIGFDGGWFNVSGTPNYSALVGSPNQFAFATPQPGSIVNAGHLTLAPEKSLTLLGGTIVNTGTLATAGGNITVAAIPGEKRVRISQAGMVLNLEIEALNAQPGGETPLPFTPDSLPDLLTGGNLQNATGVSLNPDGTIHLTGSNIPLPAQTGDVLISGTINASAPQNGASGGTVNLLGEQIALVSAAVDASGADGGGTVLIGGDYQGQGTVPNARNVFVSDDSVINVDALNSGDGGRAIVWADEITRFFGTITARGGAQSGNGGFVETSGKQILETLGAVVDTSAANGQAGDWLLDPHNITIDNVVASSGGVFSGGNPDVFTATADNAVVDVDDIIMALSLNRNVTIFTGTTGAQEGDITIATPIAIPSTFGIATLQLIAADDIFVNSDVTYTDNATGHAFNIVFSAGGDINAANRTISTSQPSPAGGNLVTGDISLTAGGDITVGTVTATTTPTFGVTASGGTISLTAGGDIRADTINTSASTTVSLVGNGNATAGAIALTAGGSITTQTIAASASAKRTIGVVAQAGAIAVSAGSSLSAGTINSSAFADQLVVGGATATAGAVQLSSGATPGSNLSFTSINTSATAVNGVTNTGTGGAASISASGGTVQGTGTGTTILTSGTTSGGTVTIEHDGGPNNVPFVIGDASQNGVAGSIDRGSSSLSSGSFPVLPNGGSVTPVNGITVTSNNTAPTLTSNSNFTLSSLQAGQSLSFSLTDLLSASDVNSDVLSFVIGAILNGTLTRNGVVLGAGDTISTGDVLAYTPAEGVSGTIAAFTIGASDGVSVSSFQTVSIEVAVQQATTIAPQQGERQPEALQMLEQEQPCLDASATVTDLEKHFTRQFEQYFARSRNTPVKNIPIKTAKAIRATLQQAEQQTGEKPALLYAAFVCRDSITVTTAPQSLTKSLTSQSFTKSLPKTPAKSKTSQSSRFSASADSFSDSLPGADDRLALWLVMDREGPAQQVLTGVTRREVREVARSFLQAVTDPAALNQQKYVEPAQQLYQWLVAPVEVGLQTNGVETLAFVVDGGLRSLPLAALHDGEAFVVERYSIGLMPSLSLSDTRYDRVEPGSVIAMGAAEFHPSQNQFPLPGVEVELNAIARQQNLSQLFLNQDFIFTNLQKALVNRSTKILHLATHADFRPGSPRDSYIQLWDSRLSLESLPQLNLSQSPAVELLILSACRTAVGDPNAELGFAGLAVQAGVKTALGSLWYVSDEGTMGLMTSFYRSLNQTSIKADALQQAQIAMLKGKVRLEAGALVTRAGQFPLPDAIAQYGNRNLSHPYYWSAFTLIGSPW